jgi:hypothetical protein
MWWLDRLLVLVSEGDDKGEDAEEKEEPRVGDAAEEVAIGCCCWYSEVEEEDRLQVVAPLDGWRCCTVAVWLLRDAWSMAAAGESCDAEAEEEAEGVRVSAEKEKRGGVLLPDEGMKTAPADGGVL